MIPARPHSRQTHLLAIGSAILQINLLELSTEVKVTPTHYVVLDRTLFYPEGAVNWVTKDIFGKSRVVDTRIEGVIFHLTDSEVPLGKVSAEVSMGEA